MAGMRVTVVNCSLKSWTVRLARHDVGDQGEVVADLT